MLQNNINHSDTARIGHTYWQVDNFKTISKIAALERAGGDIKKVRFHWMDETWDQQDWTQEPQTSWAELLRMRVWQLRDRYDHLALFYSGGWDSHTALMAFIDNKVPLDEIIIWDRRDYLEDVEVDDAYRTAEQLIRKHGLKTHISTYEIPWDYHANIYKSVGKDYIYLPGCQLCFNQTTRVVQHEVSDGLKAIKNKNSQISSCYIEAHDKPRVNLYQGKWYQFYMDSAMYVYLGKGGSEMFYFTPDLPELHIKQTYMSMQYFEQLLNTYPGATEQLVHRVQGFDEPALYAEWNRHIGRVCGPNYSAQHGLMKKDLLRSPRVEQLVKLLGHTEKWQQEIYDIYAGGLEQIREISHGEIDIFAGDMPGIMSKQYYIKDFTPRLTQKRL